MGMDTFRKHKRVSDSLQLQVVGPNSGERKVPKIRFTSHLVVIWSRVLE